MNYPCCLSALFINERENATWDIYSLHTDIFLDVQDEDGSFMSASDLQHWSYFL